jgi:hypothetical protein
VLGAADVHNNPARRKRKAPRPADPAAGRALRTILWRQGVVRKTRWVFWRYLWQMYRHNRGGVGSFLTLAGYIEHFLPYRESVRSQIQQQLEVFLATERELAEATTALPERGSRAEQAA